MIQGGEAGGYTIVETMIFLAVTAILFVSALGLIGGRQATVQFSQSVRDAQSKLQDVINQVSDGRYPSGGNITCTATPNTLLAPVLSISATDTQGTSDSCVFLGKVIQFAVNDADSSNFNVFNVASRRVNATSQEVNTLTEAKPKAIAPISLADVTTPDVTEKSALQYALKVTRITVPNAAGNYGGAGSDYGSIAFFGSFPNASAGDPTNLTSGAQHVNFGVVPGSVLGETNYATVSHINAITGTSGQPGYTVMSPDASLKNGIVICLSDQGTSRRAMLTIGGTISGTSVKLDMGNTAICTS